MSPIVSAILGIVGGLIIGAVVGIFVGIQYRKRIGEAQIGSAEQKAQEIIAEGEKTAETAKKEALLSAKEEIMRRKNEMEQEIKDRRSEVSRTETRLAKKEENLDKKSDQLDKKTEQLDRKLKECDAAKEQIDTVLAGHMTKLEEISGYTAEQAKAELVAKLEDEIKYAQAQRLVALEETFRETAEEKARNIMATAIQRCSGDFVVESTVSNITLPSDDMKGRIIGRDGRNIQKLEALTGVDLIIDDTPESILISSFDPVRREVARLALEKLMSDGRIQPQSIETVVEKVKKDVATAIKQAGDRATFELNLSGINPELVRLLGRLRYRTSYGQNVLQHSIEVGILAGIMAEELGVDAVLARRAGLLHDIGKAFPYDVEGNHIQIGAEAAKKYKESKEVIHAIEAHHGDVEAETIIAVLVQAADAISAARPGARREDRENYVKRLTQLESIATSYEGVSSAFAIQAGRELRVMVAPEVFSDERMALVADEIAKRIEAEVKYPGQVKVHLIRESHANSLAK